MRASAMLYTVLRRVLLPWGRVLRRGHVTVLAGLLSPLWAALPAREQRRAIEHLRLAYPDASPAWVRATARRMWRHFFLIALETLATVHLPASRHRIGLEGRAAMARLVDGTRRGKPLVLFSGHYGNWELGGRLLNRLLPLAAVAKRPRNPNLAALAEHFRTLEGRQVVYQEDGLTACVRALRAGRCLILVVDQDIPRFAGVHVPFFGRPAYTPVGPAGLVLLSRCDLQPVFFVRRRGRWCLHVGPAVRGDAKADREGELRRLTAWMSGYTEALIRRDPSQWVWWHRRWRTTPEDLPRLAAEQTAAQTAAQNAAKVAAKAAAPAPAAPAAKSPG